MKDKKEQINEMAKIMQKCYEKNGVLNFKWFAESAYKRLTEDSILVPKEEFERLSSSHDIVFCDNKDCSSNLLCKCCEISECPKNIPEYNEKLSANKYKLELFQKLCKEQERADSWEDRYKLLKEEFKQERKETVEKYFNAVIEMLKEVKQFETIDIKDLVFLQEKNKEIAKELGVEIKE